MSYSARVINIQIHGSSGNEAEGYSLWVPVRKGPVWPTWKHALCSRSSFSPQRVSLDVDSEKLSVPRKLLFTGPSSHDRRAPVNRELGPLLMEDHDRRWDDSSSERISAVFSAKTLPWAKTAYRSDVRRGTTGKIHRGHKQINRKVAWRTREKPVLQRSRRCTVHRPAPQNNVVPCAWKDFQNKAALKTECGSP